VVDIISLIWQIGGCDRLAYKRGIYAFAEKSGLAFVRANGAIWSLTDWSVGR
jgi:hypothetical protein